MDSCKPACCFTEPVTSWVRGVEKPLDLGPTGVSSAPSLTDAVGPSIVQGMADYQDMDDRMGGRKI